MVFANRRSDNKGFYRGRRVSPTANDLDGVTER